MSATLPKIINKRGFTLSQIAREGLVAIYRQTWNRSKNEDSDAFEVIRIGERAAGERVMAGVTVKWEAGEVYPFSEQWGIHGFTLTTRDAALARFKIELEKQCDRNTGILRPKK